MAPILGRDMRTAAFSQGAAGTTELVAAPGSQMRILVTGLSFSMSAAGTAKFRTGGADITRAQSFATNESLAMTARPDSPVMIGALGSNLEVVTTVGLGRGWVEYYLAS